MTEQPAEAVRAGDRACGFGIIPEGLEPLAVWDCREPAWGLGRGWGIGLACAEAFREAREWAEVNIDANHRTYRAEFYLLDAPFAVLYRYKRDEAGFLVVSEGEPVTEPPVIVPLAELPPAHLLR
jgi:hypothetical protein